MRMRNIVLLVTTYAIFIFAAYYEACLITNYHDHIYVLYTIWILQMRSAIDEKKV